MQPFVTHVDTLLVRWMSNETLCYAASSSPLSMTIAGKNVAGLVCRVHPLRLAWVALQQWYCTYAAVLFFGAAALVWFGFKWFYNSGPPVVDEIIWSKDTLARKKKAALEEAAQKAENESETPPTNSNANIKGTPGGKAPACRTNSSAVQRACRLTTAAEICKGGVCAHIAAYLQSWFRTAHQLYCGFGWWPVRADRYGTVCLPCQRAEWCTSCQQWVAPVPFTKNRLTRLTWEDSMAGSRCDQCNAFACWACWAHAWHDRSHRNPDHCNREPACPTACSTVPSSEVRWDRLSAMTLEAKGRCEAAERRLNEQLRQRHLVAEQAPCGVGGSPQKHRSSASSAQRQQPPLCWMTPLCPRPVRGVVMKDVLEALVYSIYGGFRRIYEHFMVRYVTHVCLWPLLLVCVCLESTQVITVARTWWLQRWAGMPTSWWGLGVLVYESLSTFVAGMAWLAGADVWVGTPWPGGRTGPLLRLAAFHLLCVVVWTVVRRMEPRAFVNQANKRRRELVKQYGVAPFEDVDAPTLQYLLDRCHLCRICRGRWIVRWTGCSMVTCPGLPGQTVGSGSSGSGHHYHRSSFSHIENMQPPLKFWPSSV